MEVLTPARATTFEFQRQLDVPNEGTVTFPLVFTPEAGTKLSTIDEAVAWVDTNKTKLLELAKVHGAILLRDFPFPPLNISTPLEKLLVLKNFPILEEPHQERKEFPDFIEEIGQKGVKYIRVLPVEDDATSAIGRGWQSTFMTADAKEAERQAEELGMTLEWLPDGSLKTTSPTLPATKLDDRTGKISWFNSIVAAFTGWQDSRNDATKAVVYGDGSPLDPVILRRCLDIMNELCCSFQWKRGDVILIDNVVTMHSRNSFEGSRRIYASLWK
ncbi:unnamed protein product [Umbelopsis ramanniana]